MYIPKNLKADSKNWYTLLDFKKLHCLFPSAILDHLYKLLEMEKTGRVNWKYDCGGKSVPLLSINIIHAFNLSIVESIENGSDTSKIL